MGRVERWAVGCAFVAAISLALACATKQDVLIAKLRGRADGRIYSVTFDQAWSISETIFRLEPTDAIEEHRSDGYILTSQNAGGLSAGTYMGVFIEPAERAGESKVTFIARRKTPTQAYPALNDATFHKKFAELVGLIRAIGPLSTPGATLDAGPPPDGAAPHDAALPYEAGAP